MERSKKIVVHCCGGTGISIVDKSIDLLSKRDTDRKQD